MKLSKETINKAVAIWANRSLHEAFEFIYTLAYDAGYQHGFVDNTPPPKAKGDATDGTTGSGSVH